MNRSNFIMSFLRRSQRGESMIAVTMAVGVAATLSLFVSQLMSNQARSSRLMQIRDDIRMIRTNFRDNISVDRTLQLNGINLGNVATQCISGPSGQHPQWLVPYRSNSSSMVGIGPYSDGSYAYGDRWRIRTSCALNYSGTPTLVVRLAMWDGVGNYATEPFGRFQYNFSLPAGFVIPELSGGMAPLWGTVPP